MGLLSEYDQGESRSGQAQMGILLYLNGSGSKLVAILNPYPDPIRLGLGWVDGFFPIRDNPGCLNHNFQNPFLHFNNQYHPF